MGCFWSRNGLFLFPIPVCNLFLSAASGENWCYGDCGKEPIFVVFLDQKLSEELIGSVWNHIHASVVLDDSLHGILKDFSSNCLRCAPMGQVDPK